MAKKADDFQRETLLLVVGTSVLSILAGWLGAAAPALIVLWLPLAYYLTIRVEPWVSIRALLVLGLFLEPKGMTPSHPMLPGSALHWDTFLDGSNFVFYWSVKEQLLTVFGVDTPISVSLCTIAIVVVLFRTRKSKDPELRTRAVRLGTQALVLYLVAIGLIEAWGLLRGGRGDVSFFQIIQLTSRPLAALAFMRAMRGDRDLSAFGTILVTVALARAAEIAYIYLTICLPAGITPDQCTTHGDSTTLAVAMLILIADVIESRSKRSRIRLGILGGILLVAMVMNNRRLAFMAVAFGALGMYLSLPPSATRKKLNRRLLFLGPVAALYMFIGEGQENPIFKPAKLFWSAIQQKDASSDSRDLENDNLVATLYDFPIFGQGYGWEYKEVRKMYDISDIMPLYRFMPHNSVLGLWSQGGLIGFCMIWVPMVLGIFIAARAYRLASIPEYRAAALAALGGLLVIVTVDWGDLGAVSDMNVFAFAIAFAIAVRGAARAELEGLT